MHEFSIGDRIEWRGKYGVVCEVAPAWVYLHLDNGRDIALGLRAVARLHLVESCMLPGFAS